MEGWGLEKSVGVGLEKICLGVKNKDMRPHLSTVIPAVALKYVWANGGNQTQNNYEGVCK